MSTNPLLIIVKRLQSLVTHLIILFVGIVIFVYFLIFGTENKEKLTNRETNVTLSKMNIAPESCQLVEYTGISRYFQINLVGNSIQLSAHSQKFDLRDILKLRNVQIDPKLLMMNNSTFQPYNRMVTSYPEDIVNRKGNKKKERYSMIISLQENLLIQRMNAFGSDK